MNIFEAELFDWSSLLACRENDMDGAKAYRAAISGIGLRPAITFDPATRMRDVRVALRQGDIQGAERATVGLNILAQHLPVRADGWIALGINDQTRSAHGVHRLLIKPGSDEAVTSLQKDGTEKITDRFTSRLDALTHIARNTWSNDEGI